jgi:hypothetical protein
MKEEINLNFILIVIIFCLCAAVATKTDKRLDRLEENVLIPKNKIISDTTETIQIPDNSGAYVFDIKKIRVIKLDF